MEAAVAAIQVRQRNLVKAKWKRREGQCVCGLTRATSAASLIDTPLLWISLPDTESKRTTELSAAKAGPLTSPPVRTSKSFS